MLFNSFEGRDEGKRDSLYRGGNRAAYRKAKYEVQRIFLYARFQPAGEADETWRRKMGATRHAQSRGFRRKVEWWLEGQEHSDPLAGHYWLQEEIRRRRQHQVRPQATR